MTTELTPGHIAEARQWSIDAAAARAFFRRNGGSYQWEGRFADVVPALLNALETAYAELELRRETKQ